MKNILYNLYPQGKKYALTMSYDDGRDFDRRVVEYFNRYGIRGTFHLNTSRLDQPGCVTKAEISSLYAGHEVSCHTYTHPFLQLCPPTRMAEEIRLDRDGLENACGYVVRGMSYPYGTYDDRVIEAMAAAGMQYSRTTRSTGTFHLPDNFMAWHPTTHHSGDIMGLFDKLVSSSHQTLELLYIWGHSYEFNDQGNWETLETFCKHASRHPAVWYATNIEIYDYVMASRSLMFSLSGDRAYNPTCTPVWVTVDGTPVEIKPGANTL